MEPFSQRHGFQAPAAEITIREEAPAWLRNLVITCAYDLSIDPKDLREWLCKSLLAVPDLNNWSSFPNVDNEVRGLLDDAPWYKVYDLIERIYEHVEPRFRGISAEPQRKLVDPLNQAFREKGVGWQLVDGKIEVRGSAAFEQTIKTAVELTQSTKQPSATHELREALNDLSRRPDPDLTGAITHAMGALECIAHHLTGDKKGTLGEWLKNHPGEIPKPLDAAAEKLWGFASENGRHVKEGKLPLQYAEVEVVVSVAAALSVYLLRKKPTTPP